MNVQNSKRARPDIEAARLRQLAAEAEALLQAQASSTVGLVVDAADIKAWIDRIGTDQESPPPYRR